MKETAIYTTVDGVEFDSKDECLKHENRLILEKSSIRLWDKWGNPITEFSADTFDKVYFIYVGNDNDMVLLVDNLPYPIEADKNDGFYFLCMRAQSFVSTSFYKETFIEDRYLMSLEIKDREGLYR